MIIDAHQHFWHYDPQRDSWITPEMSALRRDFLPDDLRPELATNGVDATVAVQANQSEQETKFLLSLAAQHKEIMGVVGWVDLRDSGIQKTLQYFSNFEKLRGFRHIAQSEPDDRFLVQPDFCRGIACLREFNFTYDILIYPRQLPAAIELVRKLPEQAFVIDHMAKPGVRSGEIGAWAKHIEEIAAHRNVWCKLSGLVTEAKWRKWTPQQFRPFFDVVLKAFGSDRLMFGSDWPVCLLSATYPQTKQLVTDAISDLSSEEQQKILGLNAMSFYGLKASHHGSSAQR
jgi:L-fuconolactonase